MDQHPPAVSRTLPASRGIKLVRRVARPLWLRIGLAAVLTVPGRRTGSPLEVTLIPVDVDGTWYLLSTYGETDWVRNLRAAGRGELRRKGRTEAFTAIEVHDDERDRVVARFRAWSPKPFNGDFERRPAAADHPAFRVEPIS